MTIDRVATSMQSQYLMAQVAKTSANVSDSQAQIASGKIANDYTGFGDKTTALEIARSAAARADAYKAATETALTQADLQNTQLTALSDLALQLRQAVTKAVADNDGSNLMASVQSIFDEAVQVLNTKDANGNYLFGGDKNGTAPVTVATLADLSALPGAASAFANGSIAASVNVADGESVKVGVLASDAGSDLLQAIKDIADFNAGASGPLGSTLTDAQSGFLSGEIATAVAASQAVNDAAALNGGTYNRLKEAAARQDTLSTLYRGFTSDIEDADMTRAILNLNQNQMALQAALQVTARLSQVSLLDFLK